MEEVAGEFAGKASFVKVDIEEAEDVAVAYGIFQIPTLLFFRKGEPVDKLTGLVAKPKLRSKVESFLAAG